MTDPRAGGARQRREDASELAARETRHALLIDLLGAYADRELSAEAAAQVEAHLVGCARCRRELTVHTALRERLASEPVEPASLALRDRIVAATATIPAADRAVPTTSPTAAANNPGDRVPDRPVPRRRYAVLAGAVLALVAGVWASTGPLGGVVRRGAAGATAGAAAGAAAARSVVRLDVAPATVPVLAAAIADYRRVSARDLPGRARDLDVVRAAVDFRVEPLRAPGLRLVAAWTTTLGGEPAAVLAYRHGGRIVMQYLVSEDVFFRSPVLRAAAAAGHPLGASVGRQGLLAWPEPAAGSLLVGEEAPEQLAEAVSP